MHICWTVSVLHAKSSPQSSQTHKHNDTKKQAGRIFETDNHQLQQWRWVITQTKHHVIIFALINKAEFKSVHFEKVIFLRSRTVNWGVNQRLGEQRRWAASGLVDRLQADGWERLRPQLTPYLLSSALSWVTTWGCTAAMWNPPPRAPPPEPPLLSPGCSTSGVAIWVCGSSWGGAPASRRTGGCWRMGEVSGDCFLFTVLALRGAGSGCLRAGLRRGGKGDRVQEGTEPWDRMTETRERQIKTKQKTQQQQSKICTRQKKKATSWV